jgi:hypothetical protein
MIIASERGDGEQMATDWMLTGRFTFRLQEQTAT